MPFSVQSDNESIEISVREKVLDRLIAADFRAFAATAVGSDSQRVSVDCSTVEFIDSSGVGALLHVNNLLSAERRPVILKGVSPSVRSVLELVRVHRMFEIVPKA